ncbi:MAG: peptidyl-prolyl cis-trans isomerase [Candidatus Dependentiae bacterium]|nr:peptidyl-prolyl cis-trans isomerase [Candidatus Dependentiae bacterium]
MQPQLFLLALVFVEDVVLYTFRKSLGKWKIVLWPIVISIAASSLTMISRSTQVATVVRVNGEAVSYKTFTSRVREFQEQINMRRSEARARGIPADFYLQLYGLTDPTQAALDAVVYECVLADALRPMAIGLHEEVVSREILKTLPADFLDASGNVDVQMYRRAMQLRQMRVVEFEDRKEEEMRRDLFDNFVRDAGYVSRKQQRQILEETLMKKSFNIAKVEMSRVRSRIAKEEVSNAELESFYESNKEQYRVAESRTFSYWVVSPSVAERKVTVSDEALQQFYDKNKNTLYRVAPRAKVRHILIAAETEGARKLADDLHAQISKDPAIFEQLAQEYSADKETAKVGGVRDFFSRGTYDKAFETAAFRLKQSQELAPVVKTDAGFEIIQLLERIPASEKAFDEVRGEIESTVRAKKAADWTRTHLEKIKKDAANNRDAIKEITAAAESHKELKAVPESKANSHSLEGLIVKNGFTLHALESYSFFTHNDSYVLVQLTGKEGSYIKPYKEVASEVETDLIASKATARVQELAQSIAAAVREGVSLKDAADASHVSYEVSGFVNANGGDKGEFKAAPGLLKKAFSLNSPQQVVLHFVGNDAYLVTLHTIDSESRKDVDASVGQAGLFEEQINEESSALSQAFISSLLRNAHVDFDQKLLNPAQREESIPYDI